MTLHEIRIHAIVTNDTDAGSQTSPFTAAQIQLILDEANQVYRPAGIQFVLDAVEVVNSTVLNQDFPPPTQDDHVAAIARQERAAQHPGKLVVFFRDGGGGASGETGDFLFTSKTDDPAQGRRLFAHEVGHYLHLAHTHNHYIGLTPEEQNLPKSRKIDLLRSRQQAAVLQYVVAEGHAKENALAVFDGDAPLVNDTPPDDGG
ncbi:MAG TPA: M12 family metallo-peptidase, partial [Cytophagales bacterium]